MSKSNGSPEMTAALAELRPYFVRAAWFSLVASLLLLAPTWYMLEVYSRVVNSRSHMTLAMVTLLVLFAYLVMEALDWTRSEVMHQAGLALDQRMAERVFNCVFEAKLRHLPAGTAMAMGDLRTVREFLMSSAMLAAMEAPVALMFLVLIFALSPVLGWTALIAALLQFLVGLLNERSTHPLMANAHQASFSAQHYADGALRNAQVIAAMGMLPNIYRMWVPRQRAFLGFQAMGSVRAGVYQALSKLLQNTVSSALLGISVWLVLHDQLNGGSAMLIAAGVLGSRMLSPLVQLVAQWRAIIAVRESWIRLGALLTAVPIKTPSMALPRPTGHVQVENILVAGPGSAVPILKNVSLSLGAGECLVVLGASASGKTTLARALVGLWPCNAGKVRLDGIDIFNWNKSELGPYIGFLPQSVDLFEGTFAENIARFGAVDQLSVIAAAKAVGLHETIMTLPNGYDSPVGVDGAFLSGGQRQRVALARALYMRPTFVVLDEPNSSLDEAGDLALCSAIADLKRTGTTFVLMTHRTSVFEVADKIMLLHEGAVHAYGPRDEVLAAFSQASSQLVKA